MACRFLHKNPLGNKGVPLPNIHNRLESEFIAIGRINVKIMPDFTDFISMKKYVLIAAVGAVAITGSILLHHILSSRVNNNDPVRLEDAIIIHGIKMTSDTPLSDTDEDAEGQIIYDNSFDDTIIDYDRIKQQKGTVRTRNDVMADYAKLRARDKRWHLQRYQIRKNDNLWKIAKRFAVHQHLIIGVNDITNPDMLKPGRYINIPTRKGVYYQVQNGDTVTRIAVRYRISGKAIIAHNRLKGKVLRSGQKIFLPDAEERSEPVTVAVKKKKAAPAMIAQLRNFRWPLRGRITSGFGNRTDPIYGQRQFHCGIDISANVGTPVHAAADGRVIFSGWKPGYGNCVIIRHDNGFITVYAHNSKNLVEGDSEIKQGALVAYSGMTGAVTGAHLHFEIRKYVNPLNPLRFLQ